MRVGILTEYPSIAVQSGPAIHTQFLRQNLIKNGHDVVLMGPDTGCEAPVGDDQNHLYPAFPYPTHPKVKVAMPGKLGRMLKPPKMDVIHSQTSSHMVHYALWIREMWQVPVVNTHVIHLPTHCHFLLSDRLWDNPFFRSVLKQQADDVEQNFAKIYNQSDHLVVQSRYFVDYWRDRGVTVPMSVIGRPINPAVFSKQPLEDPFPRRFKVGKRLLVACRHDREKSLEQLIDIFISEIAPQDPDVTLTLVGDGHDHANLVARGMSSPFASRIFFPGEVEHARLVEWYSHADVFVYTSVSETFGNVINEALWCGLPVVALNDRMGVAHQVANEVNGFLIEPNRVNTESRFAAAVHELVNSRSMRRTMGEAAANLSRRTSHPDVVVSRHENMYREAKQHCVRSIPTPLQARNRIAQWRALSKRLGTWVLWNSILLGVAHTATRLGAARTGGASQHAEVIQAMQKNAPAMVQQMVAPAGQDARLAS